MKRRLFSRPARALAFVAAPALLLVATACGGSSGAATAPTSTSSTTTANAAVGKVNANTASMAEIQAALEAAGVPNASRWAREVTEYRPYPTNDPTFGSLIQNLAKYNPSPDVVNQIVSALTL
ncbi:MAG: hypothetical protein JWN29_931 [Acidimicrobiales bacterium]|nr:hypothetical protein [Acidimicrobiales bacterium]